LLKDEQFISLFASNNNIAGRTAHHSMNVDVQHMAVSFGGLYSVDESSVATVLSTRVLLTSITHVLTGFLCL